VREHPGPRTIGPTRLFRFPEGSMTPSNEKLSSIRHSFSHVMAEAVLQREARGA